MGRLTRKCAPLMSWADNYEKIARTEKAAMKLTPKTWAWGAGILGILLVICGFLSQQRTTTKNGKCQPSSYTWVSVIVGFIMVLAGFLTLMKENKANKAAMVALGGGGQEVSISPEPSPDAMGGGM